VHYKQDYVKLFFLPLHLTNKEEPAEVKKISPRAKTWVGSYELIFWEILKKSSKGRPAGEGIRFEPGRRPSPNRTGRPEAGESPLHSPQAPTVPSSGLRIECGGYRALARDP